MPAPKFKPRECPHGNTSTCPHDVLGQVRLKGSGPYGEEWQTLCVIACDSYRGAKDTWHTQVAPHRRKRGYETRVITVGAEREEVGA